MIGWGNRETRNAQEVTQPITTPATMIGQGNRGPPDRDLRGEGPVRAYGDADELPLLDDVR